MLGHNGPSVREIVSNMFMVIRKATVRTRWGPERYEGGERKRKRERERERQRETDKERQREVDNL